MRTLSKEDLWDAVIGGGILSTGGGGSAPKRELFDKTIDEMLDKGLEFKLMDPSEVPDDELILMNVGVGGGVTREVVERYMLRPPYTSPLEERWFKGFHQTKWIEKQIKQMDEALSLNSWSEIPRKDWVKAAEERLTELLGKEPVAHLSFEIGPAIQYGIMCEAASDDKPVVDADVAGYRAVPELSLCTLNIEDIPIVPAVSVTAWGDMLVYEKILSWQRFEDLSRYIATISGGGVRTAMTIEGSDLKKTAILNTVSKSMEIGKEVRKVNEKGKDPIEAIIKLTRGYKLFKGKIAAYTQESKGAFIWGEARLEGKGEFEGHTFIVWYKNENQISRLDGKPYVTSPDLICVLDTKTGSGLSNFWLADWETGRDVTVIGIISAEPWRTERGVKIFNPKHFGFDIEYEPIEQFFE